MGKLLSIVITESHIKIAKLSRKRKGIVISRLLTKELPERLVEEGVIRDVREFADFLTSILKYSNIRAKRVVFSLPTDKIMSREVVLPEMDEEKLKTALKVNASDYFPIDLTDYVLGYFPISKVYGGEEDQEDGEGKEEEKKRKRGRKSKETKKGKDSKRRKAKLRLMVVAAPNDMVQSYFDLAKLSHLKLESLDYGGNSVFQLTANQVGEEPCLVIQLDEDHTVLTIFDNNVMVLQRHVDVGSSAVIQAAMDVRNVSYGEAEDLLRLSQLIHENFDDGDEITDSLYYLVSSVKRVIEYYMGRNGERPLDQVYLIGDGASLEGLNALLGNQLELPVDTISTLKQVFIKEDAGQSIRDALRYMDNIGAVISPVNFIPKQLEQDIRRKLEAKAYRVMILLSLFAAVVIVTVPATDFFNVAMDTIDLQNKLMLMEDVKPVLENYKQASVRYTDVQHVQSLVGTDNESLLEFINVFEQLRPSNMTILDFKCDGGEITFTAMAQGKRTVAKLIQQLRMIANVSEVKVSSLSSSYEDGQETVSFSATCRIVNTDELLYGVPDVDIEEEQGAMDDVDRQLEELGLPSLPGLDLESGDGGSGAQDGASEGGAAQNGGEGGAGDAREEPQNGGENGAGDVREEPQAADEEGSGVTAE